MNREIGPYRIESEIGRGGMGVVYLARDTRLDRDVAIKALPTDLASDPARLERFEREACTLASLSHPNVAGIYGVEEQDAAKYLVLEYVDGQTLADLLDRGALGIDDALEIARALDRAEGRCPDAKRQLAAARRLLKRLGPELEAQVRLAERRGYAPRKKPKAAKSVTGYSIEPSRKGPALAEHRSTGAAPFHCPKFAYDAVAKAIAAGPESQKFEEVREAVARILGQEPPVYWLRVATRFFCERGLLKHSRARFTKQQLSSFSAAATRAWREIRSVDEP